MYILHIKNMVCQRCVLIVKGILSASGIGNADVALGRITFRESLSSEMQRSLGVQLNNVGLEVIEGRVSRLVEGVKQAVRDYLSLGVDAQQYKLSSFISARLAYDFGHLSDLFTKVEGVSVERFFLLQRLEKVKEMLDYDELSLSEIAFATGFSSVHHLSGQFKKLSGLTPSQYRKKTEKGPPAIGPGNRVNIFIYENTAQTQYLLI